MSIDLNPLDALANIPGVKQIEDAAKALGDITHAVSAVAEHANLAPGLAMIEALVKHAGKAADSLGSLASMGWDDIAKYGTGLLFREYLEKGLGLNYDKLNGEAKQAVKTIDTMLTFGTVFPLVITAADSVLDFFLGQRAPRLAESFLGRLAEEMGLTWAMGMTIDRAFETAVGNKLEEAILHQKRPIDPEIQVIRLMLKQHLVTEEVLKDRAAHMGYSDDWADKFALLADAQLPVGDIQQLYLHEMISADGIDKHLEELGFNVADRKKLTKLYIDKAVTSAGMTLRAVVRDLYIKGLVDEGAYKHVLDTTNMPKREIDQDIAAITLEKNIGRLSTPLSTIKAQYQHHELEPNQVHTLLRQMLYTDDAIANLIKQWDEPKLPHPMGASKVLSYWYSGVLTDKKATLDRLILTGLRPDDAAFLLDHPSAAGARKHVLTPALVTAAFLDGTLDQDQYKARLSGIGLADDVLEYTYQSGLFRKSRQKPKPSSDKPLDKAEVLAAFTVGVFDPQTTLNELVRMGYSDADALVLMEIKTKGQNPFAKPGQPAFPDLTAAIAYLEAHGYAVHPPPDPQLQAAEQMLLMAGWSYTYSGGGIANFPGGISGGVPNPPSYFPPNQPGTGG